MLKKGLAGAVLLAAASGAWGVSFVGAPYTIDEEAGTATITITQGTTPDGVTVYYRAQDGTASSQQGDFNFVSGSTSWVTGDPAEKTFTVTINDDALTEPDETIQLLVGTDSDFVQVDDQTTLTINASDQPGQPAYVGAPYQVDEGAGTATITLSREGGSTGSLFAAYRVVSGTATAGEDFTAVSGTVSWADGDTADKTFDIPILEDTAVEGDETVLVRVGDSDFVSFEETTLTITDNEVTSDTGFSSASVSASLSDGSAVLTLVRGGSTQGTVTVDYATVDGTAIAGEDYVAASGTVTWADGDGADKTIAIELLEDDDQQAEDFSVVLSNVTGPATLGDTAEVTVTIEADLTRDIADIAALTPNQRVLAGWFDDVCPRLADLGSLTAGQQDLADICGLVRDGGADDQTVREALDAINPEELLVTAVNALRLTAVQHGNLSQRLNALRNGASGVDLAGLNLNIQGQEIAGTALQEMFDSLVGGGASADESMAGRWGFFVNGRLASGDKDETDNEAGFDFDLYAVTAGVDYRIKPNFIVGVSAGMGSVETDYDADGGELDIDSWNGSVYLTYFQDDAFYFDALATYGENDYDSERHIVFGTGAGVVDRLGRGETDGEQFSFGFGSGWDFSRGGVVFGPHFGGYYYDVEVDGFTETGAEGLDLRIGDQSTSSLTVNAGGHVSYAWLTDWGVLVPNARVDWVHEFEDNRETLGFQFVNDPFAGDPSDPSPSLTLQSDRPDSDYFIWSVGMSAQFIYGVSGFVNYQSYAGYSDVTVDEWSFGARWEKMF